MIVSMTCVVTGGTFIFTTQQMGLMREWSFNNNEARLLQIADMVAGEMKQFGDRLSLLAKTSEIQSMDPTIAASYLKSYSVSSLFISGETVTMYDKDDAFICDNSMVGIPTESPYPIDFSRITPHRPYITPWFRDAKDAPPRRLFGINISNRAVGDGSLIASFSLRRLWTNFPNYKIGKSGFLVVINAQGEVLYHPDLKRWLTDVHKVSELGIEKIDPRNYTIKKPLYVQLSDGGVYLANYKYDANYDFGIFSFQPKQEIDDLVSSTIKANAIVLGVSIFLILIVAGWMFYVLGAPLGKLTLHINQISKGYIDVKEIDFGKRHDEIGLLSKAFNSMHTTIKRQLNELAAHRDILEQEVRERTKDLELANQKLDLISKTDELTGLPNRRNMNETVANEIGRSQRTHKPFCFIFIDIDHFKKINDTYGHACGDVILKSVSHTVRGLLRKYDMLARYGGEEFLTLLPETDLEGAAIVAERFRKQIERMTVRFANFTIRVTITLGVAKFDHRLGADRSIQMADKALYQGKEGGRNRVVVWKPEWVTEADYEAAAVELEAQRRDAAVDRNNFEISIDYNDADESEMPRYTEENAEDIPDDRSREREADAPEVKAENVV